MLGFKCEVLKEQTNATGTWGTYANVTVPSLSKYKAIYFSSNNSNYHMNPAFVPIEIFKIGRPITSSFKANEVAAAIKYINDTTIGVSMQAYGYILVGVY